MRRRCVVSVVVDDDTLYPPRLLETFASWSRRFPDAVVSATGWPVTRSLRYPHWTENYLVYGNELVAPHPVSVVRGNCGFAVKAKFFDAKLWEEMARAPPGATVMDDVWISGHLARRRVKRYVVPFDADQYTSDPRLGERPDARLEPREGRVEPGRGERGRPELFQGGLGRRLGPAAAGAAGG